VGSYKYSFVSFFASFCHYVLCMLWIFSKICQSIPLSIENGTLYVNTYDLLDSSQAHLDNFYILIIFIYLSLLLNYIYKYITVGMKAVSNRRNVLCSKFRSSKRSNPL